MLKRIHIAFIGGDARQLEIIRMFLEMDASVTLIGYNQLESNFPGSVKMDLLPHVLNEVDAIILPVSGVDEEGYVESIFSSQPIRLEENHLADLKDTCTIYSGITSSYLQQLCAKYNIPLVLLMDRDDVAIYNSIPTVEGTLLMAIQNTDFTIHSSHCMVLGLGRVGLTLARTLHGLGAKVKVAVRKSEDMARVFEMGMAPVEISSLKNYVYDVDILFNTIPHPVVSSEVIARLKPTALIIDLASKPGGTDFHYAEKRGIKALLAPGLPGIVAPKTAGQILANTLIRLIREQTGKREE